MMDVLYDEPFWNQKTERCWSSTPQDMARRDNLTSPPIVGVHMRPQEPAAQHVTPAIWRSLFHNSNSR